MRKHFFNMIEIILAIAIISIGISSVMVLFTEGVKSTEATLKSSTLPDAAETVISNVKALASTFAEATGWNSSFDTAFPSLNANGWDVEGQKKLEDFTSKFKSGKPEKDERNFISDGVGNYLYRQLRYTGYDSASADHTYETVFSAVIQVRQVSKPGTSYDVASDILLSDPLAAGGAALDNNQVRAIRDAYDGSNSVNLFNKVRRILEVRISYPAEAAPELRDSKIYRVELYNDKYDGI